MSPKPMINEKCQECEYASTSKTNLLMHIKSRHTRTGQLLKKQKTVTTNIKSAFKVMKKSEDSLKLTVRRAGSRTKSFM